MRLFSHTCSGILSSSWPWGETSTAHIEILGRYFRLDKDNPIISDNAAPVGRDFDWDSITAGWRAVHVKQRFLISGEARVGADDALDGLRPQLSSRTWGIVCHCVFSHIIGPCPAPGFSIEGVDHPPL